MAAVAIRRSEGGDESMSIRRALKWVMDVASPWQEPRRRMMAQWPTSSAIVCIVLCWSCTVTSAEDPIKSPVHCYSNNCSSFVDCSTGQFKTCATHVLRKDIKDCDENLMKLKKLFYTGYMKIHEEYCNSNNIALKEALSKLNATGCWRDSVVCIAPHLGVDDGAVLEPKICESAWDKMKDCAMKDAKCTTVVEAASKHLFNGTQCRDHVDPWMNVAFPGHVTHPGLIVAAFVICMSSLFVLW